MSSRVTRLGLELASVGLLGLTSCEFVIADWYYIDRPRAMGTRAEVVELGPAWPQRIGFDPLDPAITEPLPGDRLRLEPMIVDAEGREIDPETLDVLWFQCGPDRCVRTGQELLAGLDTACADLPAWTMDSGCKLGAGGAIEFVVPPIGQLTVFARYGYYYMVAAVDDSRTAKECWAARQRSNAPLTGCVFADRELKVGPSWVLLADAALAGLEQDIPVTEIPAPAFAQAANRVPALGSIPLTRESGELTILDADSGPIAVRPGERFVVQQPVWRPGYDYQVYFTAREAETMGVYVFLPAAELIWAEWYTSGSLVRLDTGDQPGLVELLIDELAKPGTTSRLVVLWGDDRGSEGMRVFEFEVGE